MGLLVVVKQFLNHCLSHDSSVTGYITLAVVRMDGRL